MDIPYSTGGGYSLFGRGFGGIYNDTIFETDIKNSLTTAQKTAETTGNTWWEKALGFVLKYGTPAVETLSKIGAIKNKNLSTLTTGQIDKAQLQALIDANNGTLDKDPSIMVLPRSSSGNGSFLGLDLSNPIILILIIAVIILLINKKQ